MWVARNENGELGLFRERPIKGVHEWHLYASYNRFELASSLFPNLTWYDEPLEVNLIPKSINEKKLDELAKEESNQAYIGYEIKSGIEYGFKAGYRKARAIRI